MNTTDTGIATPTVAPPVGVMVLSSIGGGAGAFLGVAEAVVAGALGCRGAAGAEVLCVGEGEEEAEEAGAEGAVALAVGAGAAAVVCGAAPSAAAEVPPAPQAPAPASTAPTRNTVPMLPFLRPILAASLLSFGQRSPSRVAPRVRTPKRLAQSEQSAYQIRAFHGCTRRECCHIEKQFGHAQGEIQPVPNSIIGIDL
ncbi:hypothetical protein GCM10023082_40220 [Streptomyces tremellae]|uniref:Uncharacterized protein n=1 Tax=Streptomyces tremellae TaxID=1124239 RepID=A0ABP7FLU8_9ACTN